MGVDVRRAAALGRIGSGPKSGRNNVTLAEGASTRSPGLAVLYSILPVIAAFALFQFLTLPPLPRPFEICDLRQDQSNRSNTLSTTSAARSPMRLIKAFTRIESAVRRRIVDFVQEIVADDGE